LLNYFLQYLYLSLRNFNTDLGIFLYCDVRIKKSETRGFLMKQQFNTKKKLGFVLVILALAVITLLIAVAPIMADTSVPQTATTISAGII
jgi:hypothetical protein